MKMEIQFVQVPSCFWSRICRGATKRVCGTDEKSVLTD